MKRTLTVVTIATGVALLGLSVLILRGSDEFRFTDGIPSRPIDHLMADPGSAHRFSDTYIIKAYTFPENVADLKGRVEKELQERRFVKDPLQSSGATAYWVQLGYQEDDGSYPAAMTVTVMPGHFNDPSGTYTYGNHVSSVVIQEPKQKPGLLQRLKTKIEGWF